MPTASQPEVYLLRIAESLRRQRGGEASHLDDDAEEAGDQQARQGEHAGPR